MNRKVLIIDTSVLCVWLQVPGMDSCGSDEDRWDYNRINDKIDKELSESTTFVLPLAAIIETGNHITHSTGNGRYLSACKLSEIVGKTADKESPWAAFTDQHGMWDKEGLKKLCSRWLTTVNTGQSLGDASIVDVCEYYSKIGCNVEIFTGDAGLKSYEPTIKVPTPRRRCKRD